LLRKREVERLGTGEFEIGEGVNTDTAGCIAALTKFSFSLRGAVSRTAVTAQM